MSFINMVKCTVWEPFYINWKLLWIVQE